MHRQLVIRPVEICSYICPDGETREMGIWQGTGDIEGDHLFCFGPISKYWFPEKGWGIKPGEPIIVAQNRREIGFKILRSGYRLNPG